MQKGGVSTVTISQSDHQRIHKNIYRQLQQPIRILQKLHNSYVKMFKCEIVN